MLSFRKKMMTINNPEQGVAFSSDKPKFFGRRKGRVIRKTKQSLIDKLLPDISIYADDIFDINKLFSFKPQKLMLEIGFGNGEHLAGQAKNNPDYGYIGVEVFQNGVANLLNLITGIKEGVNLPEKFVLEKGRSDNIRVFSDDVRLLFKYIPDSVFDKIFLLFPDPWPKKKHASRRFINPDNLKELARILKKGGILRVATDHKVYKSWALRQLSADANFIWTAKCFDDWRKAPADHVETKYQRKAIAEGRKPVFFDFMRV